MHCRHFLSKHDGFIDDTLPGVDTDWMLDHLRSCESCSAQDVAIRRALFLVKNIPTIRVSEGFDERLRKRLLMERVAQRRRRGVSRQFFRAATIAAAVILAVVIIRNPAVDSVATTPVVLPGVVVSPQALEVEAGLQESVPTFTISVGVPLWPALLLTNGVSLQAGSSQATATWVTRTR